jgi:hypothetical protein
MDGRLSATVTRRSRGGRRGSSRTWRDCCLRRSGAAWVSALALDFLCEPDAKLSPIC